MASFGSVTQTLFSLRLGSESAATAIVERFLPVLRNHLAKAAKNLRIHDEDDIAIAAFYEFCTAIENSRFNDIADRSQLWQVLTMIAFRKANDFYKSESALKRGSHSSIVSLECIERQVAIIDERPDLQLEMFEQCEKVLRAIHNPRLRKVAEMKIRGYTNTEIGQELKLTTRSVQLMVKRIKDEIAGSYLGWAA